MRKHPKPIILILEPASYSVRALAVYRSLGTVLFFSQIRTARSRREILKKTNILVVRLAHRIDAHWFDDMPNLRVIATPTTGLNHIDTEAARRHGVHILSLRGVAALDKIPATAELTFGMMLALIRHVPWAHQDVLEGRWDRTRWRGRQLLGKTLGILGYGRLGIMVARYGRTFGMRVIAADPHVSAVRMARAGVKKVAHDRLFRDADIVSIHVLLDDNTRGLVKNKDFRRMKRTALFINTARGEIIERSALLGALKNKWIAGAAVDVLWDESSDGAHLRKNPLVAYARRETNLLLTPHIGGAAIEAMHATEDIIARLAKNYYLHS